MSDLTCLGCGGEAWTHWDGGMRCHRCGLSATYSEPSIDWKARAERLARQLGIAVAALKDSMATSSVDCGYCVESCNAIDAALAAINEEGK